MGGSSAVLLVLALTIRSASGAVCTAVSGTAATDVYCNDNCNHDPPFCPTSMCDCTSGTSSTAGLDITCVSTQPAIATDEWCQATCDQGSCPESLCLCAVGNVAPTATIASCVAITDVATDTWCTARCNTGSCPLDLCLCDISITGHSQTGHCHALQAIASDTWCDRSCAEGVCPSDLCACGVIDSTTAYSISAYGHNFGCCDNSISKAYFISDGDLYTADYDGTTGQVRTGGDTVLCADFVNAVDVELGVDPSTGLIYQIVSDYAAATINYVPPNCGTPVIITSWQQQRVASAQAIALYNGDIIAATTSNLVLIKLNDDFSFREQQILADHSGNINALEPMPSGQGLYYAKGDMIGTMTSIGTSTVFQDWLVPSATVRLPDIQDIEASDECGVHFTVPDSNQLWHCSDPSDSTTCAKYCDSEQIDADTCQSLMNPWGVATDCDCNTITMSKAAGQCTWQEEGPGCTDAPSNWVTTAGLTCDEVFAAGDCADASSVDASGVTAAMACCSCGGGADSFNENVPSWCSGLTNGHPQDVEIWSNTASLAGVAACQPSPSLSPTPSPSPSPTPQSEWRYATFVTNQWGSCIQGSCALQFDSQLQSNLLSQTTTSVFGGVTSAGEDDRGILFMTLLPTVQHGLCTDDADNGGLGQQYTLSDGVTTATQCLYDSGRAGTECDCAAMEDTLVSRTPPKLYWKSQEIAQQQTSSAAFTDWEYYDAGEGINYNNRPAWVIKIDCNVVYQNEGFVISYPYSEIAVPPVERMCWEDQFITSPPYNAADADPLCHKNNDDDDFLTATSVRGNKGTQWFDTDGNIIDVRQMTVYEECNSAGAPFADVCYNVPSNFVTDNGLNCDDVASQGLCNDASSIMTTTTNSLTGGSVTTTDTAAASCCGCSGGTPTFDLQYTRIFGNL